jgi:DNA-binding response OmpR family regulator
LFLTDRPLAESLEQTLKELGVEVDLAEQPARADLKVQTASYDAVLLDRDQLGELGYARLTRWRRRGLSAHIMVLLPADCTPAERADLLTAGADVYLLRPFCAEELRARFRALARRPASPADHVLRARDLEIDTVAHKVRRGGREIHLTPREFDLLLLLADHQGRVLSRQEIIEHLYDGPLDDHSNVVDVYIRYLRKKIDRNSDNPLILTRWGKGYLLRA